MNKAPFAAVILTIAFFAVPASGADISAAPQTFSSPITPSWIGFYVGVNAGYGDSRVKTTEQFLTTSGPLVGIGPGTFVPPNTFPGADSTQHITGGFGGLQLGYNAQIDRLVLGVEGDLQLGDISRTTSSSGSPLGPQYAATTQIDSFATFRGRIGYAFDRLLPYVTGGVALVSSRNDLIVQPGPVGAPDGPPFFTDSDAWLTGYAVGAGIEYAFAGPWTARVEYLRIGAPKHQFIFDYGAAGYVAASGKSDLDILRGSISYRFGQ